MGLSSVVLFWTMRSGTVVLFVVGKPRHSGLRNKLNRAMGTGTAVYAFKTIVPVPVAFLNVDLSPRSEWQLLHSLPALLLLNKYANKYR